MKREKSVGLDFPAGQLTAGTVERILRETPRAIFPVEGDCLEGMGVEDGGFVLVDFTRFPAPPRYRSEGGDGSSDLCLCLARFPGCPDLTVMAKEYQGVWGSWQLVGTRYDLKRGRHTMNCCMPAERIFGVVLASWSRDKKLLWERDPDSFPEALGTAPTIQGENVGDPHALCNPSKVTSTPRFLSP